MIINQASLEGISRTFSTIFNAAFDSAESQIDLIAMRVPSTGSSVDYKFLADDSTMREWIGERFIKNLSGASYTIKNKSFEKTIEVDRDDIEDDQIGVYAPHIQNIAQAAKQHPDILGFGLLKSGFDEVCFDENPFFSTAHPVGKKSVSNMAAGTNTPWFLMDLSRPLKPLIHQIRKTPEFVAMTNPNDANVFMMKKFLFGVDDRKNMGFGLWQLAYGSKEPLTPETYAAARAAMASFTRDDGKVPLGITPTHLIVPGKLESAGRTVLEAQLVGGGNSNIWYNTAKLVVSPWL